MKHDKFLLFSGPHLSCEIHLVRRHGSELTLLLFLPPRNDAMGVKRAPSTHVADPRFCLHPASLREKSSIVAFIVASLLSSSSSSTALSLPFIRGPGQKAPPSEEQRGSFLKAKRCLRRKENYLPTYCNEKSLLFDMETT